MFNNSNNHYPKNFKIFWLSSIPMFIIVALKLAGVHTPTFLNPFLNQKTDSTIQKVVTEKSKTSNIIYKYNTP